VHEPLTEKGCLACHDPHASQGKGLIKADTVAALCAQCHDTTQGLAYLHGPTAVGECSVCHDPHTSDFNDLLTLPPKELCTSCHTVTQEELKEFEFVHEPAQGDCAGCHNPHGANNAQMLRATAPEMCYACHDAIKNTAENAQHQHSVVREEGGCLKCHTPHASTVRFLLQDDPETLCLNCHNQPVGMDANEVLGAFTAEIQDKKFLHGPVQDKSCSGCHNPHGSNHFRLLVKAYPAVFYAPYKEENYALCYSCHDKTVAQTERTEVLTDFRNGDLNLHYLHVNKAKRGRTCRACHQTHASNLPKHIREAVPYGVWELPIGFVKSESGGSCAPGCHVPVTYDREQPVDYETVNKETGQGVAPGAPSKGM
jgi:predicted CXXCH cytochrome family protein